MKRILKLLRLQIIKAVLNWSGSWWFAFALAAGQLVPPLISLAVWRSVFPNSTAISTYYVCVLFTVATTASYENHTFSLGIYKGTLSEDLLKPQPVFLGPLGENIAIRMWITVFALPVVLVIALSVAADFTPRNLFFAVPMWFGAALLRFLFTWCLAMTAFWSGRVHSITGFGSALIYLLGGNAAPIGLLPAFWRTLARSLPFYSMVGLPADAASGAPKTTVLLETAVQYGWIVVLLGLAVVLWRRGLARYTAVGQ